MSATQLRPLGIGEVLDVAIKTYSKNARTLIIIGAIIGVPLELLKGVVQLSTVSSADEVSGSFSFGPSTGTGSMSSSFSGAQAGGLVVTLLITFVIALLLTAACVKAVSDAYLGSVPSVRDSLRFAVSRIRSLAWLYLVLGFGLVMATILLVIPGIWLYVSWAVATPVLLLEGVKGTAALRRSFRLVRHRWWTTAGLLLVAAIIVGITSAVLAGLLIVIPTLIDSSSVLLAVIAATISSALATMLVQPLQAAITTILYFDLRVRKEGFDLSLLAARLGLPVPEAPPFALPAGRPAPDAASGDQPPFWPPPPGWKPSRPSGEAGSPPAVDPPPPFWPPPPDRKPSAPVGEAEAAGAPETDQAAPSGPPPPPRRPVGTSSLRPIPPSGRPVGTSSLRPIPPPGPPADTGSGRPPPEAPPDTSDQPPADPPPPGDRADE